jgi:hypothetical protein
MNLAINIFFRWGRKALIAVAVVTAAVAMADTKYCQSPKVFQAAGPNADSIRSTVDNFRNAFGGINNNSNPGPIDGGRREINWDGGGSTATSPGPTPFDVFLNTRGNRSTTPGTGFVQATAQGLADFFGQPEYATIFAPFSQSRLFSSVGSNITDTTFFVPGHGDTQPAVTRGFGLVFTDVDQPDGSGPGTKKGNRHASTLVEYFDANGALLFSSFVPASPGDRSLSFFGIIFDDARIASVHIVAGGAIPGEDDSNDAVVMDDFIYGEPVGITK